MSPFTSGLPGALQDAGLVLGLVISLTIASYLIKDNLLARLGQYVLVGSGLGYMAVLAWRNVLWPRLFAPLIADPMSWLSAPGADPAEELAARYSGAADVGRGRGAASSSA